MLTVNVAATHPELVLVGTVKAELGITDSANDALIANYIRRASEVIERYTGRRFARETVTELLASEGSKKLLLARRPIVSITHVKYDGSTISSTTYTIDNADAGILWRDTGWTRTTINRTFIATEPSPYGRRDWEIKYVAGYIPPGSTAGESNLPADIEYAASEITKAWYLARSDNPNIRSQRVGDSSEQKFAEGSMLGIPPNVQTVLEKWRSFDLNTQ